MQPPSIITLQQRSRRLSADLETPISLFLSLTQNQTPGLLLESAEVDGRWGRYSVIACDYLMTVSCVDAKLSLSISDDRLASLKELEGMPYLDGLRALMQKLGVEDKGVTAGAISFTLLVFALYLPLTILIPSSSGLATLSIPIVAPLGKFAGVGGDLVVTAFQSASGLVNIITPTAAVVMGALALGHVPYDRWVKYVWKLILWFLLLALAFLVAGVLLG